MTMMFTRAQAAEAATAAASERDTIQANLLDLDGGFGKQLLTGAQLTGVSKQRWDTASAALAGLWDIFNAYTAVIDQAGRLAAGHLGQRELTEISGLLTGPSVSIARAASARRDIADPGYDKVTLATARARMRDAFAAVTDVTSAAEEQWSSQAGRLDAAASALAVDPMGDAAVAADLASARAELDRLRDRCQAVAARAASLAALRSGAGGEIAAIRALAESCRAAQASAVAAYQRAAAKIAAVPPVPAAADPAPRLAELDALLAGGRWDRLRSELDLLRRELTAVAGSFQVSERTLVSLLSQRDELRGLLDAYKAKAARLGAAEDSSLAGLYDNARALLWTAPCDLTAAAAAVTSYQQAVLAIGAR